MNKDALVELYSKRIDELTTRVNDAQRLSDETDRSAVDAAYVGTLNVVQALYGPSSAQAKTLLEMHKLSNTRGYSTIWLTQSFASSLRGVLANTKEELEAGLISSIAEQAAGEVIGDLVALAREQLREGYKDVAAVLASAALEDAVKRKAAEQGINVQGKTLDSVINALKTKQFFTGAQAPIVASYVKLRNSAMHADWPKIQEADVSSLLGFLEPFLLKNFT
jgi:hypothetical protein